MIGSTDFVDMLYKMTDEEKTLFLKEESQRIIDSCNNEENKRRLAGLQWKIDCLRVNYKKPEQRMIILNKMMTESALTLKDKIKELDKEVKTLTKKASITTIRESKDKGDK